MVILQNITKDLDMKRKIYARDVGRDARDFTKFYAPMQDQTKVRARLFSIADKMPLYHQKILRDDPLIQEVKIFTEWASRTEL